MKRIFLGIIRFYQKYITSHTPAACRFVPTCSQYAFTAIQRFGALKGIYLAVKRLLKCHPFHPAGTTRYRRSSDGLIGKSVSRKVGISKVFDFIGSAFGYIIFFGYKISGLYVLGLILFTIAVKLVLFPLSIKQQKTTAKQQRLGPKMQELKERYGNEKRSSARPRWNFTRKRASALWAGVCRFCCSSRLLSDCTRR